MRSQIIDSEIKILESHRSVTSADLGEQGVRKIYHRNNVTGEEVRRVLVRPPNC